MTVTMTETEMPLMGSVGEVLGRLGDAVVGVEQCEPRRGIARIDPARTVEVAAKMLAMDGARLATATAVQSATASTCCTTGPSSRRPPAARPAPTAWSSR